MRGAARREVAVSRTRARAVCLAHLRRISDRCSASLAEAGLGRVSATAAIEGRAVVKTSRPPTTAIAVGANTARRPFLFRALFVLGRSRGTGVSCLSGTASRGRTLRTRALCAAIFATTAMQTTAAPAKNGAKGGEALASIGRRKRTALAGRGRLSIRACRGLCRAFGRGPSSTRCQKS